MVEISKGIQPFPMERPMSLNGSPTSATSVGRTSFQNHARTFSMATDSSNSYRMDSSSVGFSASSGRTSLSEMQDSVPVNRETETLPPIAADGNFLTAIAAQERKVLELKEELERAEFTLDKLKKHWAQHEARRKRDDVRHLVQLQPLQTSFPKGDKDDDSDGSNAWIKQEMKRRKTLLSGPKPTTRTVFSGSRHTRALSLLSPKDTTQPPSQRRPPPRKDHIRKPISGSTASFDQEVFETLRRPATATGSFGDLLDQVNQNAALANAGIDHEALLRHGKKFANNFKDGLWTFLEDLRQATVGEEAIHGHQPRRQTSSQTLRMARKQTSKNSLRPSSRGSSVSKTSTETKRPSSVQPAKPTALPDLADPSFWTDHGVTVQPSASTPKKVKVSSTQGAGGEASDSVNSNDDAWDTWDESPAQSRTSSVFSESNTLASTVSESPRTSTSTSHEVNDPTRKDSIPWPTIKRVGTNNFKRTVSHLMREWDKLDKTPPSDTVDGLTGESYFSGNISARGN